MRSEAILLNEYKELSKEKWVKIELQDNNLFRWTVDLMVLNSESLYYGGYFRGLMVFSQEYPFKPPQFTFTPSITHPNIYADGRLCISILHAPGDDELSGETAGERWTPAQRVETVLLSIISLLDDAEISSPANVDAAKLFRDDKVAYKAQVARDVERSKKDIPEGFVVPTDEILKAEAEAQREKNKAANDDDFWAESDDEMDFGSGTDEEDQEMSDDEPGVGEAENDSEEEKGSQGDKKT